MKALVKIGGTLIDSADSRHRLARELTEIAASGVRLTVVHGGGKQMTRFLAERGIESRFVNGLRVTTPETIDAVLKVFTGSVNHGLVSAFVRAGGRAVGLSGIDAALVEAEPLDPALGAVGRPVRANVEVLDLLTGAGYIPVVACVAGDRCGRVYNVNADQMAAACASALRADRVVFLTDVGGVLKDNRILPVLTLAECDALIRGGIATGGMHAKLAAAAAAIQTGVSEIVIAPGAEPGAAARALRGEILGTRIVKGDRPNA